MVSVVVELQMAQPLSGMECEVVPRQSSQGGYDRRSAKRGYTSARAKEREAREECDFGQSALTGIESRGAEPGHILES